MIHPSRLLVPGATPPPPLRLGGVTPSRHAKQLAASSITQCVFKKMDPATAGLQVTEQCTVEIDWQPKPACVAETLMRLHFQP